VTEGPNERSGKYDMDLRSDKQQNIQLELDFSSAPAGEAREAGREETESLLTAHDTESPADTSRLMEEVCERENLKEALRRVKANKGSAGVDGMTVATANPFPAAPARAASMVALSASRFVCDEISVMVSVTLPISRAATPS
jgi:hypothetical protein